MYLLSIKMKKTTDTRNDTDESHNYAKWKKQTHDVCCCLCESLEKLI